MTDFRDKMHLPQIDVEDFHRALDIPIGHSISVRRPTLRADLIMEEAKETVEALTGQHVAWCYQEDRQPLKGELDQIVDVIDGMCDLIVVTYGTAVEMGVNLAPFWNEVHRTNMAKRGGPERSDGKKLKPPGWHPPDLHNVLRKEMRKV